MDRWHGKVAVVTGASSGIGSAIVVDLLRAGMIVVGLARRIERVQELRDRVAATIGRRLHAHKCDVTSEADIVAAFEWVRGTLGGVDILVNNAGVYQQGNLLDAGNSQLLRQTIDVNIVGLVLCTREAVQSMRERQVAGHVVLINSVAGHRIPYVAGVGALNIYPATKYAVTAITEVLRQELNGAQSGIKVTSISPGMVDTEMMPAGMRDAGQQVIVPHLQAADVAAAVLYAIGTPAHVQVHELTIKPVGEGF